MTQLYLASTRSKKYINHATYLKSFADISIFLQNLVIYVISGSTSKNWILIHKFLFFFYFYWVFIGCFNQYEYNVIDVGKIEYFRPPENKGILKQIFLPIASSAKPDHVYTLDVLIWPKFGKSGISMREAIKLLRARSLVFSDLHSETKGSRFKSGC